MMGAPKNTEQVDIKELREYIAKYLLERMHLIHNSLHQMEQYNVKLKTWCVTLFMAAIGFCLKVGFDLEGNFKGILFWLP